VVNILSAPSTIPDPFGTIFKVGRIAFLTATTAAQIANINAQQAEKGIFVETEAETKPKGKQAIGLLTGSPHNSKQKGIPISVFGKKVMAEHGEFLDFDENGNAVVINKRSSTIFKKELEAVKGLSFDGKLAYLSGINSFKGFGIPFMEDGGLITPDIRTATSANRVNTQSQIVISTLDPNAISVLAREVGKAVEMGSMKGTVTGAKNANREAERQAELESRESI
jgi:hypothetical protein